MSENTGLFGKTSEAGLGLFLEVMDAFLIALGRELLNSAWERSSLCWEAPRRAIFPFAAVVSKSDARLSMNSG